MDDIHFITPLEFTIEIIALENGVSVHFSDLNTEVEYEWLHHSIDIHSIEREYKNYLDPLDPDDIRPIENESIDLTPVIREEIIMATHSL